MKIPARILIPATAAADILGSGCVAIPMGTETFTTEYPTDIRPTSDAPISICQDCELEAPTLNESHLLGSFRLVGTFASEQKQEQHYATVTVEKQKRIAFGLFPGNAESFLQAEGALQPMLGWEHEGNGTYTTAVVVPNGVDPSSVKAPTEPVLSINPLGFLNLPYSLLYEPFFGDYGCDSHHWRDRNGSFDKTNLLGFFPEEKREKIGAWTWKDAAKHEQCRNWSLLSHDAWIGFHKYCSYVVRAGGWSDKRTPAPPKTFIEKHALSGPYSATLTLPSVGYAQTVDVEKGRTSANFNLADAANGERFADGTIHFRPSSGVLDSVQDSNSRAILEKVQGMEFPVSVELPAPRLQQVADANIAEEKNNEYFHNVGDIIAPYQITAIKTTDGKLIVQVSVTDGSKTFEIDHKVQPEVRRMFREQFATGPNASRRESVRMAVEDGGKSLVYTVEFE